MSYADGGALILLSIWDNYKIPMTIASLSIPLTAWAIAHHRSEQALKGLELQTHKRLYDMYYEQQKHFELVMSRRIETAGFKFIAAGDLPVIFSQLYEFNNLHSKNEVSLKQSAIKDINDFLEGVSVSAYGFYQHYQLHKENKPEQSRVLDGFIDQMYTYFHQHLLILSDQVGTAQLEITDVSVKKIGQAYSEIISLCYYMGSDFECIWKERLDENGMSEHNNVLSTIEAIDAIIQKHMGIVGESSYKNFKADLSSRDMIKMMNWSPLQHLYSQAIQYLFDELTNRFSLAYEQISVIDGPFEKYQFPLGDSGLQITVSFHEQGESQGDICFSSPDTEVTVEIRIHEETDENGQNKYTIGDDFGAQFLQDCFKITAAGIAAR